MYMAVVFNTVTELKGQKTPDSQLDPPWPRANHRLKIVTDVNCRSLHLLPKHAETHLDYGIETESHSSNLSVQAIPFRVCKVSAKNSLNLAYRSTKLAVLISVGQTAASLFCYRRVVNRA